MRKFILVLILFLFTAFPVSADTISGLPSGADVFISQTITLTDNAAAVDFSTMLGGGYLFAVEILAVGDDAVTVKINSALGTELFTRTTTAATDGEIANPSGYWPIGKGSTANYTLTDFTGSAITIIVTVAKK